ncbi:hypothetical protein [Nonomuraea sp. CA-141351]|uniref:hypothetical protein n=1 Tax=Nonomuraea sp. CA-141351 TaxID=3239996 RepID=UPI003D8F1F2C
METRLYTRTNPANGQIEIKHFAIDRKAEPGDFGPVWMAHFYGTDAPADFYAPGDHYSQVDALEVGDTCYIADLDGTLDDFLPRLRKELDAEGWILLPPRGTRYLAHATGEAGNWHTLTGEPVTGNHIVVITEAEPTCDEDGTLELAPTNRVAAVIDTGVPADEPAPYVAERLDQHGWLVVGEGDPAADDFGGDEFHEVAPADPAAAVAVDYDAGRPVRHYEVGRPVLDERRSLARAVVCAVHVAAEGFDDSDAYGLTRDDVQEILLPASRAAVDERLAFEQVPTLGDADSACKQRLFAEACSGITNAVAMIRQRATCRSCDAHATTRTKSGQPACANSGH